MGIAENAKEKNPIIECKEVSFCYAQERQAAIRDISFRIYESEFVVLCGQSGCGKTTLLKHLKKNQIPFGTGTGSLLFRGQDLEKMSDLDSATKIGYVGQNPESQIVTDTVWNELSFGLENLGMDNGEIRRRISETAAYFGMESIFRLPVAELSGGQKQMLNLASVLVMKPELLILDEPAGMLDPIGTQRFLDCLGRLNREFGMTIILSEQRLEEVLPMADRVLVMDQGRLLGECAPGTSLEIFRKYREEKGQNLPVYDALPAAMRVYDRVVKPWQPRAEPGCDNPGKEEQHDPEAPGMLEPKSAPGCDNPGKEGQADSEAMGMLKPKMIPVSVRQGQEWLRTLEAEGRLLKDAAAEDGRGVKGAGKNSEKEPVLMAKDLCFGYRRGQRILEDFSLAVERGSIFAIMGGNGSGKTTALKVLMDILKPVSGRVRHQGKMLYLAQNPVSLFTELTVEEELEEALTTVSGRYIKGETGESVRQKTESMLAFLELSPLKKRNPLDLSGGERQRLALGKLLMLEPDILLLDEPTKGLDAAFKEKLAELLKKLCTQGKTVVLVSHDMEFCGRYATHCGLLFDGCLMGTDTARAFFAENSYYTTAAGRMTRGILSRCVTVEDVAAHILIDKV